MNGHFLPFPLQIGKLKRLLAGGAGQDVFRNMAVLAVGAGSAKIIGFAATPVITRIYTPQHLGVLSVFTALVALIVPMATLRYVIALPLPKSDRLAINLVGLCLLLMAFTTVLITAVIWMFGQIVLPVFSMQVLQPYWWLIGVGVAGTGLYEILSLWATRKKAFKPIARTQVWQTTLGSAVKICLGLLAVKPLGLLIGQVVQQGGGILSFCRYFADDFRSQWRHVSRKRMGFLLKRYAEMPKFRLPSQFLLVFSTQAPLLFSAMLFGTETTGQIGLALTALALPVNLFGQTTANAYYAEIASIGKNEPEKIYRITKSVFKRLFLTGLPPTIVLLVAGRWLFSLAFGPQWEQAGVFASILAIYLLLQYLSAPLVNVFTVFEMQGKFLLINGIRAALILTSFVIAMYLRLSPTQTISLYSGFLSVHYGFVCFQVFRLIK